MYFNLPRSPCGGGGGGKKFKMSYSFSPQPSVAVCASYWEGLPDTQAGGKIVFRNITKFFLSLLSYCLLAI